MAILVISQPAEYTAAHGKNRIKVNTLNPAISQIKYDLEKNGDVLASQFSPIYPVYVNGVITFLSSNLDVKGLYMSALPSYNNPLNTPSAFTEIDAKNHQVKITDVIYEDAPLGDYVEIERYLFKATEINFSTEWNASKNYLPYHRDKNNKIIRKVFNGMKIPISYYTLNYNLGFNLSLKNAGGTSVLGLTNIHNNYRLATFTLNTSHIVNSIMLPLSNVELDIIVDKKDYERKKVIYFLNRYGGWDWFCAIDYESREIVDKRQYTKYKNVETDVEVMQLSDGYILEQKLYGSPQNAESYEYLKDMVNSPIILDENGERIRLIDNSIRYDFRNLVEPQFTIQYIKKENINY